MKVELAEVIQHLKSLRRVVLGGASHCYECQLDNDWNSAIDEIVGDLWRWEKQKEEEK